MESELGQQLFSLTKEDSMSRSLCLSLERRVPGREAAITVRSEGNIVC